MNEPLDLDGCRPTPLASYLKALGVLRLVAEQADPEVQGWWEKDRFRLRSTLDRGALLRFFQETYAPTPIIAPWNGGSGFYPKDKRDGIDAIDADPSPRFDAYRRAIALGRRLIAERGFSERPSDEAKSDFIGGLRALGEAALVGWIDAAVALTLDRTAFPPLLGTGGNDGRLDFTNNFMQRVAELLCGRAAEPHLLASALFDDLALGLSAAAVGQFSPGAAGGPNAATGVGSADSARLVNAWDFVLMLEGAVMFAGGVSRRLHGTDASYLSYPFTVRAAAAGFGTASLAEQADARGELWAPLWDRPATHAELRVLFREGRLSVGARPARDGLDAARALGGLAADRRVAAFQRFGFVKRQGLAFLATPLDRRQVRPSPRAELLSDLDRRGWLDRVRRMAADKSASAGLRGAVRSLEEGVVTLLDRPEDRGAAQAVLAGVGAVARCVAIRPKLRETLGPPPRLSAGWRAAADDGSPAFRVAAALGALAAPPGKPGEKPTVETTMPFAAHLGPLDGAAREFRWAEKAALGSAEVLAVWGEGSLIDNLGAVVRRRLLEAGRRAAKPPFAASVHGAGAWTDDIANFLADGFDDRRAMALLLGLAWTAPARLPKQGDGRRHATVPFAYAAIAPLFASAGVLDRALRMIRDGAPTTDEDEDEDEDDKDGIAPEDLALRLIVPPALSGLLAAGRVGEAVQLAQHRVRVAGLPAPFQKVSQGAFARADAQSGRRLLAALAIPARAGVIAACLRQAYPSAELENAA